MFCTLYIREETNYIRDQSEEPLLVHLFFLLAFQERDRSQMALRFHLWH